MAAVYTPCCAAPDATVMAVGGSIVATPITVAASIVGAPETVSASVVATPIHSPHRAPAHSSVMAVTRADDLSIENC